MVNGAKIAKRRGQIHRLNAELNKFGLIIHHTSIARRGPKSITIVVIQHILSLPFQIKTNQQVFPYPIMAKTTIMIKKTMKMKNRIFKIPQPVLLAPLKPKIPENIISTTAMIAKIQKILMSYSFYAVFLIGQLFITYPAKNCCNN